MKSFGFLVLGLSALRLVWRKLANPRPRDPNDMGLLERVAARTAHVILWPQFVRSPPCR